MDRVLQRRDTAANWSTTNPILAEGEIGIITDGAKGYKIGDGVTRWNALEYPANPTSVVGELGDSEVAVINQQVVTNYVNSLCTAAGEVEQHVQSVSYNNVQIQWKKSQIILDLGGYTGNLLLSPVTPFDDSNYVTVNNSNLPFTLVEDYKSLRSTVDIDNTIRLKGSLFGDVKNLDNEITELENIIRSTSSIDTTIQLSIGLQRDVEVLKQYWSQNDKPHYMQNKGDMTDGTLLQLNRNSVSTFNTITFSANVVSFTKLLIGHGRESENIYRASWLEIDNTNIVVCRYESAGSIKKITLAHGLTVSNTIQLELNTEKSGLNLRFTSNGAMFEQTVSSSNWGGSSGTVFVQSEGSVLNNAVLGWSAKTINSHIWAFGDSYFAIDPTRWPYYLLNNGYQDILLNAYGGQKSIQALSDLQVLLNNGTPKYILWCMGMNDADSSTEVNSSWLSTYESVKELCSKNNIELVLSTIPTVSGNGSIRINKYKNSIVKSSGFRYIDFDSAVGADETTGEWYTGMLSSDGVHPSVQGAITLYNKAISDFPELVSLKTLS